MKYANIQTMILTGGLMLFSMTAWAADADTAVSVKNMSDGESVTLAGTVEDFTGQHFTLRDASGSVKVDLSSAKPIVLKNGQQIDVTGVVDKGIFGTSVDARNVSVDKGVGERIGEAIDSVTGQDAAGSAQAYNIQSLPESGLVKVNGSVADVGGAKKFTLKDQTGHIDVSIKSDQSASLHTGTEVTVIGYVNKGILEKNIDATEVDIRSTVPPVATQ